MIAVGFLRTIGEFAGYDGSFTVASQSFIALVFLTLAFSRLLRDRFPANRLAWRFGVSLCFVIPPAMVGGLACSCWNGVGVPFEKDWRVAVPSAPVDREERVAGLLEMWRTVQRERPHPTATRNEMTGVPPEKWAMPGEAGANWFYLAQGDEFFILEPYPMNGERLVTGDGVRVRPVEVTDLDLIRRSPGGGL